MFDPTREEIDSIPDPHLEALEADKFDVECAVSGQDSNLYEVLSESLYCPGKGETNARGAPQSFHLYNILEEEYKRHV